MIQQFVDRDAELEYLNSKYASEKAEFIIIYGRRRIGKTELIREFIKGKKSIYVLVTKYSMKDNIEYLKHKFSELTNKGYFMDLGSDSIFELFSYFIEEVKDERLVIVFDEYPYLIELNRGIGSVFQKLWDELLQHTKILLILCGSSIEMMETEVLDYKSPLYGRRTGELNLGSFGIRELKEMFPNLNNQSLIEVLAVFGGTPFYLAQIDQNISLLQNVQNKILKKNEVLYNEPLYLLKEEFREPKVYATILKYMSLGYNTHGKLQNAMEIDKGNLSAYLQNMENTRIIEYVLPFGQRKRGLYYIKDPFFNFWFRFVYPDLSDLELGLTEEVAAKIDKNINMYLGQMFELLAFDMVRKKELMIGMQFQELKKWWYKNEEIDMLALNENDREIGFFEIKWRALSERDIVDIISALRDKARLVDWHNSSRSEKFGVIAKKVDPDIKQKFKKDNILVFDLDDLPKK